jgi:hypothetical protein
MGIGSMNSRLIPLHIGGAGAGGSSATTGTFAATATGFSSAPSFNFSYIIQDGIATIYAASGGTYTGTSDTTGFSFTGLPAALTPGAAKRVTTLAIDNNITCLAVASVAGTTMTMLISQVSGANTIFSTTSWTASGVKGLLASFNISYPL